VGAGVDILHGLGGGWQVRKEESNNLLYIYFMASGEDGR
jgi:hypothetical protein